ncbi:BZIP family transcription factor [Rasamsonia emersonii CBS 393.64]|uniref:BZIP family transcription factor n=1 Tax=Rasamsonia emersonii (strain ATCC 16479 / CBS 393.64 / IMI 116815) TaxID=1408163 RepID=A0A0F4YWS6_RASE3|nr:BZIP family transcription factor [Rasamsonia emersonii CBS 393.64]KKA22291.1 BZIP family transcription factor [Rasamsonia emersonii CBS 393.64]
MPNHSMNSLLMKEPESPSEQLHSEFDQEYNTLPFTKPYRPPNSDSGSQAFSTEIISSSLYQIPEQPNSETAEISSSDSPRILYGGLTVYNEENADRDDDLVTDQLKRPPQSFSAKKRSNKNAVLTDGNSSRKRGRPRILAKDETATERRRTQIRLAQRAYRLRKEATISLLNDRVAELEATIEEMSKSFLSFHDEIMASGLLPLQPALVHSLRNITEKFLSLARLAKKDRDPGNDSPGKFQPMERALSTQKAQDNDRIGETRDPSFQPTLDNNRWEVDDSNTLHKHSMSFVPNDGPRPHPNFDNVSDIHTIAVNNGHSTSVLFPSILAGEFPRLTPIEIPLNPMTPYTYSFEESTFARRLHRSCLERGYRLLTDPSVNPEEVLRTFRFSFGISNRKRIISRFQKLLSRGVNEALETWNLPFFHLGGAGTHYPRRDQQGNPVYPPNLRPITEAIGPWPFHLSEIPHENKSVESLLVAIGFDGEWFDSHDVEGFLQEKGIFLDGHTSFVELPQVRLSSSSSGEQQSHHQDVTSGVQRVTGSNGVPSPNELPDTFGDSHTRILADRPKTSGIQSAIPLSFGISSSSDRLETVDIQQTLSTTPSSHGSPLHQAQISGNSQWTFDVGLFIDHIKLAISLGHG